MGLCQKSDGGDDERQQALKRNVEVTVHLEELDTLLERLHTNVDSGLTTAAYESALAQYGDNLLTPPPTTPEWVKFIKELTGFFSLLLWAGAILCFIGYALESAVDNLYLGVVLVFVVMATGIFSYLQNSKSESLMASFAGMLPPKVKVLRNGKMDEVDAVTLVPGDIVNVEGGDLIPADMRVLRCSDNMQVDNASLTGESEPQKRRPRCTHDDPLETQNLCFFGTQVPEGSATCVVTSTGDNSVMGRIAALAMQTKNEQTPINKEIHHFILIISGIAITLGVSFFVAGLLIGTPIVTNLVFMIGIIVANVPEGLLATVTVCLTLTAKRMADKKVLVKNLEGVETLGSTSCICSDKTGTLTQNIMTVAQLALGQGGEFKTVDCPSSFTGGRKTYEADNESFIRLLRCGTLCNVATFTESSKWTSDNKGNRVHVPFSGKILQGDGSELEVINWNPVGNASECAMIKLSQSEANPDTLEGDVDATRQANPIKFVIPFNSKNKYQVHIHDCSGTTTVVMKGAPERILMRCDKLMIDGVVVEMTADHRRTIEEEQLEMSSNGLRCLGFAELELDAADYGPDYQFRSDDDKFSTANFPLGEPESSEVGSDGRGQNPKSTRGLIFLGLMALIDPPRPAVPPAVKKCMTAGVKVIMVTGDHPVTAEAIARKVGILWSKTRNQMEADNLKYGRSPGDSDWENPDDAMAIVVPGHTISVDTSQESWDFILGHPQIVFARTSPQQKLVIVEQNQRQGHIVAVTGDGVNDSPAIKKADIGIAMGIMGSEVTKNAADMILLDDNFASIVNGVEEGRLIFDNLKKSIAYTIQSNIPEITPFLGFIIAVIPLPLTTILILAIDLGTDMIPAISMAYETAEADIMQRPPRNALTDRLVTSKMINFSYLQIGLMQALGGYLTYMVVLANYGYPPNILMYIGSLEFWGVQPLFCKFKGGAYVNYLGDIDQNLNPELSPPQRDFPLWSQGADGYVQSCVYPLRDYEGGKVDASFNRKDSSTYKGATDDHAVLTMESIMQAESAGFFKYIPWKSRLSPFWENQFLWWDTDEQNGVIGNLGADTGVKRYFSGLLAGLYSLCLGDDGKFGPASGSAQVRGGKNVFDAESNFQNIEEAAQQVWQFSNCSSSAGPLGKDKRESGTEGALFCNGLEATDSDCSSINFNVKTGDYNQFQAFYCMDTCGQYYDPSIVPWCTKEGGSITDSSPIRSATYNFKCKNVCYPPTPNADGSITLNSTITQCLDIASESSAREALAHAQGAFWGAIVIGQIAGLIICKTRWLSVTRQGLKNSFMNFGMFFELVLVSWLAYCGPINTALGTRNIKFVHWFVAIPFAILIFLYDESRKGLMRATSPETVDPNTGQVRREAGWLEKNTYY